MTLYQVLVAEAKKLAGGGLEYLNTLRENRGLVAWELRAFPTKQIPMQYSPFLKERSLPPKRHWFRTPAFKK